MISLETMSLSDLRALEPIAPELARFAALTLATTHEEYVKILYSDIDIGIGKMEDDPAIRQDNGEDRLTEDISLYLTGC